ncbi:ATP-binding cassette domain-containing protein [Roseicyclus sp. F158]|uniref:ATP-binding cassette domain-containing protein n=1 Tax=Tropicimonas omnivorans TaxID=3075590 RepID=A0ABU3DHI9_9RHOB|nr:ATP-binding cassette domain-containing protein [Roseicyclus sp. F158]MDT0683178.1 ATP-binding cassette domain-containing protein [Roseicyclus sp. F158]
MLTSAPLQTAPGIPLDHEPPAPDRGQSGIGPEGEAGGILATELQTEHLSPAGLPMAARALPIWAASMSTAFTVGAGICLLAIGLLAVFFQTLVAEEAQTLLAPLLAAIGIVPVIGSLVFDYAHTRALAGYRALRLAQARRANAWLGGAAALMLAILHPLLGLGVVLAAAAASAGARILARRGSTEPLWDVTPEEATALLAGRDAAGLRLARSAPEGHAMEAPLRRASGWLSALVTLAAASYLAGTAHLTTGAVPGAALIALWAGTAVAGAILARSRPERDAADLARTIEPLDADCDAPPGLAVRSLTVTIPGGWALLSGASFSAEPGTIIGVSGPSGAGKTLLLRALSAPYDLAGLDVRGSARINGRDPWARTVEAGPVPTVHLPPTPLVLPASGLENLTCFHAGPAEARGKQILERLVFSADEADRICTVPDASVLPSGQTKALAFARGFLLAPDLYLLDRPEDGLGPAQLDAVLSRLRLECQLGRVVLMVTENRALLEACDKLLVLQDGRVSEFGDASEIRAKQSAGWAGFTADRTLESEEALTSWVEGRFRRPGDEANRRAAAQLAAEMLAFSCQTAAPGSGQRLRFELKLFEGHGVLRMIDDDPALSSGKLEQARRQAMDEGLVGRMPPLARVLRYSRDLEASVENDHRLLTATLDIYDPRAGQGG